MKWISRNVLSLIFFDALKQRLEQPDWSQTDKRSPRKGILWRGFSAAFQFDHSQQDDRAPEEDWTAGLPIISSRDSVSGLKEVADGIILSLEQTENYELARGPEGDRDDWHDRKQASMTRLLRV